MTYIDSALLDAAEWFCRRFQTLTGRTNVWLAVQLTNLSIIVYFVWAGVYFWISRDLGLRVLLALFCGALFYGLTQTIFKVSIEEHEANAYRRVAKGLRNPRRLRDAPLRIAFLTLSIVLCYPVLFVYITPRLYVTARAYINVRGPVILLSYFLIVLTTVLLYLLACDPLPPCPGKVKEWLRRTAPSRVAASEPSTADYSVFQKHVARSL